MIFIFQKKINAFFILFFSIVFVQCNTSQKIDNKAIEVVNKFNKKCPMMIDSETRMDGIDVKNNSIVYKFTLINLKLENVDTSTFNKNLRPGIINSIKENKDLDELKRINSVFEYYYKDLENKFIYSFKINPEDYNN
jgi:hypothetical protein